MILYPRFLSYHLPITEVTGRFAERLFNEESNTNLQMQEAVEIVARIVEEKENVKNLKDFRSKRALKFHVVKFSIKCVGGFDIYWWSSRKNILFSGFLS